MSLQGKHTPLSINVLCALLKDTGLTINPNITLYAGSSTGVADYTKGNLVSNTALDKLSDAIRLAFSQIGTNVSQDTYNKLISIGSASIPALGNSKPSTYTQTYTGEETSHGFVKKLALQANTEFKYGTGYKDFLYSFGIVHAWKNQHNKTINSLVNAKDMFQGVYSNMNDLSTSDISGVNKAFFQWGQDLIKTGKAIDLSTIDTFGNPYNLLMAMNKNHAITDAVNIALVASGLTTTEITDLVSGKIATIDQQKKIYAAFTIVLDDDLKQVLIPLNVQTEGLQSLADLLDPKMLFPVSRLGLTVPVYNIGGGNVNSKIYYLIYTKTLSVNSELKTLGFGKKLTGIIPEDIAMAANAFSTAMMQIKNIKYMDIEKFAQVVVNMEVVATVDDGSGRPTLGVNGTTTPNDSKTIDDVLAVLALGSGPNKSFTMYDFYGSMTDVNYKRELPELINLLITAFDTTNLKTIYNNILTELGKSSNHNSTLNTLITQANTAIAAIKTANPIAASRINILWDNIGSRLNREVSLRASVLPNPSVISSDITTTISFVDYISDVYSQETDAYESAQVLEAISDTKNIGGQSIIALMREARNAKRLGLAGGVLDNDIPDSMPVTPITDLQGEPRITGATTEPGSFAGSPETNLVPQNLDIFNISNTLINSVFTVDHVVEDVTRCNCDCWDNLEV